MNALDRYFEAPEPSDEEKKEQTHDVAGTFKRRRKTIIEKSVPEAKLNAWYLFSDCFETSKSGFFLNRSWRLKVRKPNVFLH